MHHKAAVRVPALSLHWMNDSQGNCDTHCRAERLEIFDEFEEWHMIQVWYTHLCFARLIYDRAFRNASMIFLKSGAGSVRSRYSVRKSKVWTPHKR